jgi:hypothetical protein
MRLVLKSALSAAALLAAALFSLALDRRLAAEPRFTDEP